MSNNVKPKMRARLLELKNLVKYAPITAPGAVAKAARIPVFQSILFCLK